ncbi:hypothetical protein DPMN_028960 [Dreissena polymorpha]|uniref:Uncharacterized protein n=1 Tax=Dreissena polymorpha TaxID=45954 RepID=A0A9D4LWB9_DREPO|nr:hypothetical protein DPMN_028960 [Dreissena polymorpha]
MNGLETTNLSACWKWSPDDLLTQISILPELIPRLLCDGVNRQHISCDLHSGTGGNTISLPVSGNQGITCSLQDAQHLSSSLIYSRSFQRPVGWLSRKHQLLPSEWTLHQEVTNQISSCLLICNQTQSQTPSICESGLPSSSVFNRRVFVRPTGRLRLSPILIPQILAKLRVSLCSIILIAPWWPRRSWFNDLLSLLYDYPRTLPHRLDLLSQEADFMRIQQCSTNTSGRYHAFLSGLQSLLLLQ